MKAWNDIVKAAMLGTSKAAPAAGTLPQEISDITAQANAIDKEEALLQTAALLLNYKKAGQVYPETQAALPVAKQEAYNACSARSTEILIGILSQNNPLLLNKWIELCTDKQQLVPPQLLPQLLEKAKGDIPLRSLIEPIIGERGLWLATLNDEWAYVGRNIHEVWENGKPEERKDALRRLRAYNPEEALTFIELSWKGENANMRLEILKILQNKLSINDEPFLAALITDKGKNIKGAALDMLFSIKESAINSTLWQTVKEWISYKKTKVLLVANKEELILNLPSALPQFLHDLGFEKESTDKAFSDSEFWLYQVISKLDPTQWAKELSDEKFLSLLLKNDQLAKFIPALLEAIIHHNDKEFAKLVFQLKLETKSQTLISNREVFYQLLDLLDDSDKISFFNKGICKQEYSFPHYVKDYLWACKFPWGLEFTRTAFKDLNKEINSIASYEYSAYLLPIMSYIGMWASSLVMNEIAEFKTQDERKNRNWDALVNMAESKAEIIKSFENQ